MSADPVPAAAPLAAEELYRKIKRIEILSRKGEGTRVIITLPLQRTVG